MLLSFKLSHKCSSILEALLISCPHRVGTSLTLQVAELMEHDNLLLSQRLLERDSGLLPLIREVVCLDSTDTAIIDLIDRSSESGYDPKDHFFKSKQCHSPKVKSGTVFHSKIVCLLHF